MIDSVQLRQFRSHEELMVDFTDDTNLIIGPNGSGKTSVLEAIYTTLTGSSWRGSNDDMVRDGSDWAIADVVIDGDTYSLRLDGRDGQLTKSRLINKEPKRKGFPTVLLLEPTMIDLVVGGPRVRREWLDGVLSATDDDYSRALRNYERSLSQRNALLKREVRNKDQLFVWNIKLAELGAQLVNARSQLVESSKEQIASLFEQVAGYTKSLDINYSPKFEVDDYSQQFMNYLEQKLERDIAIGFTPTGPHREEVTLMAESGIARDHLSRGEQLILAFALVYAQVEKLSPTVVLIDDYTSDLDQQKSDALMKIVAEQKIIAQTTSINDKEAAVLL